MSYDVDMRDASVRSIVLCYYAKTEQGWKYFTVPRLKMRTHIHTFDAISDVLNLPGRFVIRRFIDRKTVYTNIDCDPRDLTAVKTAFRRAMSEEYQRAENAANNPAAAKRESLHILDKAIAAYLSDCKSRKAYEAHRDAAHVLKEFKAATGVVYTKDVHQDSILKYQRWLRANGGAKHQHRNAGKDGRGIGASERTVKNKTLRVLAFARFMGIDVKKVFDSRKYMPRPEKKLPKIYEPAQIDTMMSAIDGDDSLRIAVLLGLKMGLRELEIAHAAWSNIDWVHSVYAVRSMPSFDWMIKDKEERSVPIPADLLTELKAWRERHPNTKLIVGTVSDKPNYHLLRSLKRAVRSSGFNCGECRGCTGSAAECSVFDLHTLRRTYITTMLRAGFDVSTIQSWVGHADLASTMAYLRPAAAKDVHDKLNRVTWGSE